MSDFAMEALVPTMLVESLGWALLHFLWQGALVAALYGAGRLMLVRGSPRLRLWLGYAALVALALLPMLTFAGKLLQEIANAPAAAAAAMPALQAIGADAASAARSDSVAWVEAALPWLVAAWLLGVLVLSVRGVRQWRALRRLCTVALPADARWRRVLDGLRERMGIRRGVDLRECALVAAPMLVGWIKPVILLPASLCTRLPPEQIELLLAHELAHVRRLDYLANLLQLALETALFYHPAVHWISRCVRDDREQCCDDMVTQLGADRLSYARALLTLAESHVEPQHSAALAATGGALLGRIERIVDAPRSASPAAATTPLLVLAGALALAALGIKLLAPALPASVLQRAPLPALLLTGSELAAPALQLVVADLGAASVARPSLAPLSVATRPEATLAPDPVSAPAAARPADSAALPALAAQALPLDSAALLPPDSAAATPVTAAPALQVPDLQAAPLEPMAPPLHAPAAVQGSAPAAADTITPVSARAPEYPRRALVAGVEGHVTLSYAIAADGRVADVRIEDAQPVRTFDRAALEALSAWRFAPGVGSGQRLQQTFDFRLDDAAGRGREECIISTGSRLCRPRP